MNVNCSRINTSVEVRMGEGYPTQFSKPPLNRFFNLISFGFNKNFDLIYRVIRTRNR